MSRPTAILLALALAWCACTAYFLALAYADPTGLRLPVLFVAVWAAVSVALLVQYGRWSNRP
jgi:hypothetical protein